MSLERSLTTLESSGLIHLAQIEPELEYLFRHALVQEATYRSILRADRRTLHRTVAEILERLYQAQLDTLAFLLGQHWREAGEIKRACEYFIRAGDVARITYANQEAIAAYTEALALATEPASRIEILLNRGKVLQLVGKWPEAEVDYQTGLNLSKNNTNGAANAKFLQVLGVLARLRGELDKALDYLNHARKSFEKLGERVSQEQTLSEIGRVYLDKGEFDRGRKHLNISLVLARTLHDQRGIANSLYILGNAHFRQGDHERSRQLFEESLVLRRQIDDKRNIISSLNALGSVASRQGDLIQAKGWYEEGLKVSRLIGDLGNITLILGNMGKLVLRQGDFSTARAMYEESLKSYQAMGDKGGIAYAFGHLGLISYEQGDYSIARTWYEKSLFILEEIGDQSNIASVLAGLGDVAFMEEDYRTARDYFTESLRMAWEIGDQPNIAYALVLLGAIAVKLGDYPRAIRLLAAEEPIRAAINIPRNPVFSHIYNEALEIARSSLGSREYDTAWVNTRKYTLEETITDVLLREENTK